jgi:hypothetical protein
MSANARSCFAEITALKPPARLRLAAEMLDEANGERDQRKAKTLYEMAYTITTRTSTEMGAALAMMGRGVK